jgi:DNA-binding LytR/AlgR family response regulator
MTNLRCIIVDDEEIARNIIERFIEKTGYLRVVGSCPDAISASELLSRERCDILFLDVEMPGMSGLDLLTSLRQKPQVILVTSKEDYALQAFNLDVCDYLVKPVQYARFLRAVSKAKELVPCSEKDTLQDSVFVKVDGRHIRLMVADIDVVKGTGDYVTLICGKQHYIVHSTMSKMEEILPVADFCRVHKSYIVNVKRITAIEENTIVVNGAIFPVGAQFRDGFFKRVSLM